MNGTRQLDFKQRQKFISLSCYFLQDELKDLHIAVQALLRALQEGLMTPTVVMNCVN
jgi:hypothetical protein